jgi:hypothetical protein
LNTASQWSKQFERRVFRQLDDVAFVGERQFAERGFSISTQNARGTETTIALL